MIGKEKEKGKSEEKRLNIMLKTIKYLEIGLAGAALLAVMGYAAYQAVVSPAAAPAPLHTAHSTTPTPATPAPEARVPAFHYYTRDIPTDYTRQSYALYALNLSPLETDMPLMAFVGAYTLLSYDQRRESVLFQEDENELVALSLKEKAFSPIAAAPDKRAITSARFLKTRNAAVYISADIRNESAENSELHIINLSTKKDQSFFLKEKSPLYAGFRIAAISPAETEFFLTESGGDGGGVWRTEYAFDTVAGKLKEIKQSSGLGDINGFPELGIYNPSVTKTVLTKNSTDYDNARLEPPGSIFPGCLKSIEDYRDDGYMIIIRDTATGAENEIYRNLSNKDNYCKNILRRIDSVVWADDRTLLFSTVTGIYRIDIERREPQEIYRFPRFNDPRTVSRPSISFSTDRFIIFSDNTILDLNTKKILNVQSARENITFLRPE